MTKAFIIRFHYEKDTPEFDWRVDYFSKEVLPRIMAQTDQNFDIAIWCEKRHEFLFKALSPKIKTFQAQYQKRDSHLFIDYTPWENVVGLEKYNIQMGLDSDDLIEPNFVEKVSSICTGQESIQVSFQPVKFDIFTHKKYKMDQYNEKRGSPIFAFYQPNFNDYKFAYHTSHLRMPGVAQKTVIVPEGFVMMSIHGNNDSTKIKVSDKEI